MIAITRAGVWVQLLHVKFVILAFEVHIMCLIWLWFNKLDYWRDKSWSLTISWQLSLCYMHGWSLIVFIITLNKFRQASGYWVYMGFYWVYIRSIMGDISTLMSEREREGGGRGGRESMALFHTSERMWLLYLTCHIKHFTSPIELLRERPGLTFMNSD